MMAQGVGVTRTLRRERRALAGRQIVSRGGAQLEGSGGGGGVGRVPEGIQPNARRLAVGHLVVARRAEAAHSQPGELRASVQEHRHGWGVLVTSDPAETRVRAKEISEVSQSERGGGGWTLSGDPQGSTRGCNFPSLRVSCRGIGGRRGSRRTWRGEEGGEGRRKDSGTRSGLTN